MSARAVTCLHWLREDAHAEKMCMLPGHNCFNSISCPGAGMGHLLPCDGA